jgi:hypothetical protein
MAKSDLDVAVAAENTQGRSSMGRGGTAFSSPSASPVAGKSMPRNNKQAADPAVEGQKARVNRPITAGERNGAAHTIITNIVKQNDPAAGTTLANSPIIPAVTKRGFSQGIGSSY